MITLDKIRNSVKFGSPLREVLMEIADRLEKLEAAPKWVGLTGAEVNHILAENVGYLERMMKEVEAKLKEKNT
jgi:hypothetical protein